MNRRNLFAVIGAAGTALVLGRKSEIRRVEFSPPGEMPAIYWMRGHDTEMFMVFNGELKLPIRAFQVRQGWASHKLSGISLYISDERQENFEPITYWIPADWYGQEAAT